MAEPVCYKAKLEPKEIIVLIEAIQRSYLRDSIKLNITFTPRTEQAEVLISVKQDATNVFVYALEGGSLSPLKEHPFFFSRVNNQSTKAILG